MYDLVRRQAVLADIGQGSSLAQVARSSGVSRSTIRAWVVDRDRPQRRDPRCFVCGRTEAPPPGAYLYLLGQYLGDGCLTLYHRSPKLRIACADSYPRITAEVVEALRAVSGRSVQRYQARGCSEVSAYWKHWPCLLPQHGRGRKHRRRIVLTDWQQRLADAHPWPLLRGLIHSDGCRSVNTVTRGTRTYRYPRYFFSNESSDIIGIATGSLDALGVRWRMCRPNLVAVSRRRDVAMLDAHIGPKV